MKVPADVFVRLHSSSLSCGIGRQNLALTHFVDRHELLSSVLLRFVERCELDVLRVLRFVPEGRGHGVHVMGANSHKLAFPADVLVKLLLKIDERFV